MEASVHRLLTMELRFEQDVVLARQRARQIANELQLGTLEQTRFSTAVSEIARNAFRYAKNGKATFSLENGTPPKIWVSIEDQGPGFTNLAEILDGCYASPTGMGLGIIGTKRLMDEFTIKTAPGQGTSVSIGKELTHLKAPVSSVELGRIAAALVAHATEDALSEVRRQNRELLQALDEIGRHKDALNREREKLRDLNQELADTNRGVLALNAELEDRAAALRAASEAKSRFLSHMTHEFRTPVNAILSLTRILLTPAGMDALSSERLKQVGFIRSAAENLSEMVNNLLDTAKADAGHLAVHPRETCVKDLFATLRMMLRPLLVDRPVDLVLYDPVDFPILYTDESKLSQILRNFISNAIKFTEQGLVEVRVERIPGNQVRFAVSDTGPGIAAEHQEKIFEEFTQIEGPHQRRVKGTGLGLPLARRLATLLGGEVAMRSELGAGSTFAVTIPILCIDCTIPMPSRDVGDHAPVNDAKARWDRLALTGPGKAPGDKPMAKEARSRASGGHEWTYRQATNGDE